MSSFEVEFVDGTTMIKDTDTADQAKAQARTEQRAKYPADTPRSAAEVKIKRVTRLEERVASKSPRDK